MKNNFFLIMVLLGLFITTSEAQSSNFRNRERHSRVIDGMNSGQLTRNEIRELKHHKRAIHRAKKQASMNGRISRKEAKKIRRMEKNLDREIFVKKHNRQECPRN